MKIYFDENTNLHLVRGLQHLQEGMSKKEDESFEVVFLPDIFGKGAQDEDWIPVLGAEGSVIITHDLNIHRTRSQRELYKEHGLGAFFFTPPSLKTGLDIGILSNKSSNVGMKLKNYPPKEQNAHLLFDIPAVAPRQSPCKNGNQASCQENQQFYVGPASRPLDLGICKKENCIYLCCNMLTPLPSRTARLG
jgi:hypothetical protein